MLLRDDSDEALLYCLDGVGSYDGTKFIHYKADGTPIQLTTPPKRWMFAYSEDLQEYVLSLLPGRQPTPATELPCDYYTYDVTVPRKGSEVLLDMWWMCVEGDPKRALMWDSQKFRSPQCNPNESVGKSAKTLMTLQAKTGHPVSPVFVPVSYIPKR